MYTGNTALDILIFILIAVISALIIGVAIKIVENKIEEKRKKDYADKQHNDMLKTDVFDLKLNHEITFDSLDNAEYIGIIKQTEFQLHCFDLDIVYNKSVNFLETLFINDSGEIKTGFDYVDIEKSNMLSGVEINQDKIIDENALPITFNTQVIFSKKSIFEPYYRNNDFVNSKFTKFVNKNGLSEDGFTKLFNQLKTIMNDNTEKLKCNMINKSGEDFKNRLVFLEKGKVKNETIS